MRRKEQHEPIVGEVVGVERDTFHDIRGKRRHVWRVSFETGAGAPTSSVYISAALAKTFHVGQRIVVDFWGHTMGALLGVLAALLLLGCGPSVDPSQCAVLCGGNGNVCEYEGSGPSEGVCICKDKGGECPGDAGAVLGPRQGDASHVDAAAPDAPADVARADAPGPAQLCCQTGQNLLVCDPSAPWTCDTIGTHPGTCADPACTLGLQCTGFNGTGTVVTCGSP